MASASAFFHIYQCDIAPAVEVLGVVTSDMKARPLIHLPGSVIEVRHIEDDAPAGESLVREFQSEPDEVEAKSATGQIRAHPEPIEEPFLSFFVVQRPDEATIFVANCEEPLRIPNRFAVVVVEVIRWLVTPRRHLRQRRARRGLNSPLRLISQLESPELPVGARRTVEEQLLLGTVIDPVRPPPSVIEEQPSKPALLALDQLLM